MELNDRSFIPGTIIPGAGIPTKTLGNSSKLSSTVEEVSLGGNRDTSTQSNERLKHLDRSHTASVTQATREYEEIMSMLLTHAKDKSEAEREFAWLKVNIRPRADLREMAEFYCIGKGRYDPAYSKREKILKASLDDIQRHLDIYNGKEREEFKEGLKTLSRVVPQTRNEHVFHCRALDILEGAMELLRERDPIKKCCFQFGAQSIDLPFNPPAEEKDYSISDAARICAELYKDQKECKYYYPKHHDVDSEFVSAHDRNQVYMGFKVMRGFLGGDPRKIVEMRDLYKILGDGWASIGLMMSLDIDHPGIREELKKLILDNAPDTMDMAYRELASVTHPYTFLAQTLRPGDDLKGFIDGIQPLLPSLATSLAARGKRWENKQYIKEMLDQIDLLRGDRNSAVQSLGKYKTLLTRLCDNRGNTDCIVDLFSYTKQNLDSLQKVIPGAQNYEDVNNEVTDILSNQWVKKAFPETGLTDVIKMGYEQLRPDETLRQSCERLIYDYGLLGDAGGRGKLGQKIKRGVERGDFPGMGVDSVSLEIERIIKMKRIMGETPANAVREAYDEVSRACRRNELHQSDDSTSMKVEDDFVLIGGLRLDRRKE